MVTIKLNSAHGDEITLGTDGNMPTIKLSVHNIGKEVQEAKTSMTAEKARLLASNLIEIAKQCESRRI